MKRKIIVCPKEEKKRILLVEQKQSTLNPISFLTKEEFLQKKFFSYDERVFFFLMKKYHWTLDVINTYLKYLYVIDETKQYKQPKLQLLSQIKKELMEEKLLLFHPSFSNALKDSEIEVSHYYHLDLFEENALSYQNLIPEVEWHDSVYEFSTMEEEINFVCIQILSLVKQGIPLSKIYLSNVGENYYYLLKKIFSFYHIPINIPFQNSIYSSFEVQEFLKTKQLPEEIPNTPSYQLLIPILESFQEYDLEDPFVMEVLVDRIKHTYYPNPKVIPAIEIKDFFLEDFSEDEYVFIVGFNQDVLPAMKKDTDYLDDSIKKEVSCYTSSEWNQREKKVVAFLISRIPHVTLSYKKESPFESYYPSSLIQDYSLEVISNFKDTYQYSHLYNQIRLGEKLDQYYLYGEKDESLDSLLSTYQIPYRTYSNEFMGISHDLYYEHLDYPLRMSYTSLNSYYECKFQYYLQYVLKVNLFEDTFSSFIGSMYHKILSLYRKTSFDFETEYNHYLEKREFSLKEKVLLMRIKKDLLSLIDVLKKQNLLTGFDHEMYEEKVEIPIPKEVSVLFVGYIDKIMFYQNIEDTYFSIVDYKTGFIDTHIEPMKYGLHMQLPVYLYLVHYGKVFSNPIFTGIYYQQILFPTLSWSEKIEKEKQERYYLQGYSTDRIDLLEKFDPTYQDSQMIRSMKYTDEKGFGTYSKVLNDETVYQMVSYTKDKINEAVDGILKADFSIDPKMIVKDNVSCQYCSFKDICFYKEKDLVSLDKVEDLSFLGGEE